MKHPFWERTLKGFSPDRDLSKFKTWAEVRQIPIYTEHELVDYYYQEVLELLVASPHRSEWEHLLLKGEPRRGHTEQSYASALYKPSPSLTTTGFRLKSLHHLLAFESLRGRSVLDYDLIVEFGAGIGDTAHAIFDRGFRGRYIVVDFPEITRISSYYLEDRTQAIHCVDDLPDELHHSRVLFIATWSLSETPLDLRAKVAAKLAGADYLIVFQCTFYDINNLPYFVQQWPIETGTFFRLRPLQFHQSQGGSWYMVGTRAAPAR